MSTHKVEVFAVHPAPHPNADRLSLVVVKGWQVVVGKDQFADGDLCAYVQPDYVVPQDPPAGASEAFDASLLKILSDNSSLVDYRRPSGDGYGKGYRVKVKKFRGEWSQGLLVKAPKGARQGDDVMLMLGVGHYDPPFETTQGGECEAAPESVLVPKFDVEPLAQFPAVIKPGTPVVITEKLHGTQGRWFWDGTRFWAGSKEYWRKESPRSVWWRALEVTPKLKEFLQACPNTVVYGEVYGSGVQDLQYGMKNGDIRVATFDVWDGTGFVPDPAKRLGDLPWAPELYRGPFDAVAAKQLADGNSTLPGAEGQIREGIVVRTQEEAHDPELGRVILKIVSNSYLARGKK